jgi:hypothetical protein
MTANSTRDATEPGANAAIVHALSSCCYAATLSTLASFRSEAETFGLLSKPSSGWSRRWSRYSVGVGAKHRTSRTYFYEHR